MNIQGKREVTNEQTKKICDFSDRAFCELARCQPDHESKPWNIANFISSICTESQLSVYTWKLYNIFQYISDKSMTIITNNGRSLSLKRSPDTELVLIGGQVGNSDPNGTLMKTSMTGDFAVDMISKISATKCVLGVSGISVNGGLTSLAIQDPAVNKAMIQHCNGPVIVVADHRKIGVRHNYYFGSIHDVTHLITDSGSDPEELEKIRNAGITVCVVDVADKG